MLKVSNFNWGAKPYRVLNCWFQHKGSKSFVEEEWRKIHVKGWAVYILKERLKILKGKLEGWNKVVFGDIHQKRVWVGASIAGLLARVTSPSKV